MKDTFKLWGVKNNKTGKIFYVDFYKKTAQEALEDCCPINGKLVKLECRIVQPKRKPKRGKYPNDNFGLPAGYTPHNPDKLTREQVGEGFRLLATVEIGYHREFSLDLSTWLEVKWGTGGNYGCFLGKTYRVPINAPLDINPELK